MTMATLYIAHVESGGHFFEAVDVMPSLARARLFREIEAFKGGASAEADFLAAVSTVTEVKAGTFRRGDA